MVVPEPSDVTQDVREQEVVIRNEHAAYVEAKEEIDREKESNGRIPDRTVSKAYLELIGHQALSYCARLRD